MKTAIRPVLSLAAVFLAIVSCQHEANADAISVFGTGVAANGSLLPSGSADPHYQLISYPGQVGNTPAAVYVFDTLPFGYLPNGPSSKWISPSNPFGNSPGGVYTYRTTFDLSGYNPSFATLIGRIASDNEARIFLNGVDTGITTPTIGYSSFVSFSLTSGFVSGVNTLDIRVTNDPFVSFNPTALRLDLSGTVVPEPASVILGLGLFGAMGVAVARTRKAKATA